MNTKFVKYVLVLLLLATASSNAMIAKKNMILIGAGGKKGQEYFNLLKNKVNFVAFIHPNPRQELCSFAQNEGIDIYPNAETAAQNVSFDGAIVSTPHYLHFPYTETLLEMDKFVIKEKPIALTKHEVNKYRMLCNNQTPKLFTIVQRQFFHSFMQAKRELENIGRIYSFKYEYNLKLKGDTTGWRAERALSGGGALLDMGYHTIDMIVTFFGVPTNVDALFSYKVEKMKDERLEDEAFVLFKYPNGLVGNAIISRYGSEKKEVFEIFGELGVIVVTPSSCCVYDTQGTLIKQCNDAYSKEEEILGMFTTYLDHVDDEEYIQQELKRHEINMNLIDEMYK